MQLEAKKYLFEPTLEDLQFRYGALAYKKDTGALALAEVREMRDLREEISRMGDYPARDGERVLRVAEDKAGYDPGPPEELA